ncbi:MAG: HDIG domain-containing protein [Blastochloris sp.]|nr:HDIG domain-containing protein [Blastochloris sp.]
MFNWLKKKELIRKGLSCGKTRRQAPEDEWRDLLECSPLLRYFVLFFGLVLLVRICSWNNEADWLDTGVLCFLVMVIATVIIPLAAREVWNSNRLLLLFVFLLCTNLLINKSLNVYGDSLNLMSIPLAVVLVPCAIAPMLATILMGPGPGYIIAFMLALLGGLFLDPGRPDTMVSSLLTGFAATLFSRRIRRRSDILMVGVRVSLVGLGCAVLLGFLYNPDFNFILVQSVWALFLGVITAFIVSAVLPALEWTFDRITDITWLELSDLKHPLLKRLSEEATGTYLHSLNVANLAEAAAEAIDANPTQCRVCSYFHDIGKLAKPEYFIENSRTESNPHDGLNPTMSSLIIISHVKEGINLALQHGLRQPIIDVIREHHGTSLVYYFYQRAVQQQKDAIEGVKIMKLREDDLPNVEERSFRYPGPIPQTKESAIISLADTIESASRSLRQPSSQKIEDLVKGLIEQRIREGQLDESQLTFNEISTLTERFIYTLKNMLHARIDYPKAKREKERDPLVQPAKTAPDSAEEAPDHP